jgi:hypothetical protein
MYFYQCMHVSLSNYKVENEDDAQEDVHSYLCVHTYIHTYV